MNVKKFFATLIALVMVITLMPSLSLTVHAADAPNKYVTDFHGIMAYNPSASIGIDMQGYVDSAWRTVTYDNKGFGTGCYGGTNLSVTATPIFVADGKAIALKYEVKNNAESAQTTRFYVYADTKVNNNDHSINKVNTAKDTLTMSSDGVAFFAISTRNSGITMVPTQYGNLGSYNMGNNGDPTQVPEYTADCDSAFVAYWPEEEIPAGETKEYYFVGGIADGSDLEAVLDSVEKSIRGLTHKHTFTYVADGATLAAVCGDTDESCELPDKKLALSLEKGSGEYPALSLTVDTGWAFETQKDVPSIVYSKIGDDGVETTLSRAPYNSGSSIEYGEYKASITIEDATASLYFKYVEPHTCSPAEAWTSNETQHWHACVEECEKDYKDSLGNHGFGTTGKARYTCTACDYVDPEKKEAALTFDAVKETAYNAIDNAVKDSTSERVKEAAKAAKEAIEAAETAEEVETAKQAGLEGIQTAKEADYADLLTATKDAAKKAIDEALGNDASEEEKVVADAAKKAIDAATTVEAVESKKTDAVSSIVELKTPDVSVSYHTHIQTLGDMQGTKKDGEMAGTSGMAKRLENIQISVSGNKKLGIQYSTHCQTYGWLPWSNNGEANGTSGEAKRLESIKIQLIGADKDKYDVYYRVHAQSYGWLGWAKNGEPSGTAGFGKRLEGIQIVVRKKGEPAPGLDFAGVKASATLHNEKAYIAKTTETITIPGSMTTPNVMYKTHVQSFGWQKWVLNGMMSGTSGKAKRLEGINIKLSNCDYAGGIRYMTHIQTYGWNQGWKANGDMAGTSGQAKRLEAIKIELTGEMANHYDVYYRVHAQSFGWLGWAKNGEEAGTAGLAKRLEGIQIVLVPKGSAAPGMTYQGILSVRDQAFIEKTASPTVTQNVSTTAPPTTTPTNSSNTGTVWKSATGSKYHSINNCSGMNAAKAVSMTEQEAIQRGLTKCSNCW